MDNPEYILYILLGYTLFDTSSSDTTGGMNKFDIFICDTLGQNIRTSLKFDIGCIKLHIHHWLLCLFGFILFNYMKKYELMYICLGGMLQGIIKYSDWKDIIMINDLVT